ncbi:MAG: transposase [Laribacter sp.]|nr:transposase [Laribacter sp.]MBP9528184.1 transposase [Laribacter sp.]
MPTCNGKPGSSAVSSDTAIQFCRSIKYLFSLALRQAIDLVEFQHAQPLPSEVCQDKFAEARLLETWADKDSQAAKVLASKHAENCLGLLSENLTPLLGK